MGLLKGIVLFVGDTHTDVSLNLYLGLFIYFCAGNQPVAVPC